MPQEPDKDLKKPVNVALKIVLVRPRRRTLCSASQGRANKHRQPNLERGAKVEARTDEHLEHVFERAHDMRELDIALLVLGLWARLQTASAPWLVQHTPHLRDHRQTQPPQQRVVHVQEPKPILNVVLEDRSERSVLLVGHNANHHHERIEDQLPVSLLAPG